MKARIKSTWYILGAGSIGCLWACYLRLAGFPVVLVTRTHRESSTLTLSSGDDQQQLTVEQMTSHQLKNSTTKIEYLLVCTKAHQTLPALTAIKDNIAQQATLLMVQNGMAAEDIPAALPSQDIFIGITTDGCYRTSPMTVVHAGQGSTYIGGYKNALSSEPLIELLPHEYLKIQSCTDIESKQFRKLAINCAINGLTVIYQCRNGGLLKNNLALNHVKRLCEEVIFIAKALGMSKETYSDLYQQTLETLQLTAHNFSSMHQDIAQSRLTEIDFLNGYLCKLAAKNQLPCPENTHVLKEIKQRECQHQNA